MRAKNDKNRKRVAGQWLVMIAGNSLWGIVGLAICNTIISVSAVISALVVRAVIDAAVSADKPAFTRSVIEFGSIILLQIIIRIIIRYQDEKTKAELENRFKEKAYRSILVGNYQELGLWHTGELLNRMTNDTKVVAENMANILPGALAMLVKLICAMGVLMLFDMRFATVFLLGGILLAGFTYIFRKKMKGLYKQVQETDGKLRSFLQETLESLIIIRSFRAEARAEDIAVTRMQEHKNMRMRHNHFSNFCNFGFGALMNGGYFAGLVWCGAGILNQRITFGTLSAVLQLINQIQQPFASVSGYIPKYYSMLASAERLMELEELTREEVAVREVTDSNAIDRKAVVRKAVVRKTVVKKTVDRKEVDKKAVDRIVTARKISDNEKKKSFCEKDSNRKIVTGANIKEESIDYRHIKNIVAEGLTFAYPNQKDNVLENASITIQKGDILGIVGQSGIGKSTLLKLLLAVYSPWKDVASNSDRKIAINSDNEDHVEKKERTTNMHLYIRMEDGRKLPVTPNTRFLFSYVPQGNQLLSGTIADAIDFLHPRELPYTTEERERMKRACRIACADTFIEELPHGYDSVLGEKGTGLSEGQLQRLAIARAIYYNAPILLLDEATSALDEKTELVLLKNLKELTDKTVLIVTHRKPALSLCNRVVSLKYKKFLEREEMGELV